MRACGLDSSLFHHYLCTAYANRTGLRRIQLNLVIRFGCGACFGASERHVTALFLPSGLAGLTPSAFWRHRDAILDAGPAGVDAAVEAAVEAERARAAAAPAAASQAPAQPRPAGPPPRLPGDGERAGRHNLPPAGCLAAAEAARFLPTDALPLAKGGLRWIAKTVRFFSSRQSYTSSRLVPLLPVVATHLGGAEGSIGLSSSLRASQSRPLRR